MPDDDDTLIEALLEVMDHHPDGDDAPPYSFIDGALAGLLIVGGVPPEEWLPKLKAGPDGGFADPAMGERFAQLLLERQAGMAAEMLDDESGLDAVYELDDREEPIWQIWLAGLGTALGAQGDQLAAAIESDDEDMATAWSGLIALLGSLPGLSGKLEEAVDKDDLEELTAIAPDIIPYFVETIYRRQRGLPRIVMGDDWDVEDVNPAQQPRHVEKIGRNDPCPCGSGKKFKKCCGG